MSGFGTTRSSVASEVKRTGRCPHRTDASDAETSAPGKLVADAFAKFDAEIDRVFPTSRFRGLSFDHLVGAAEQRDRKRETECLRGFEIDDQLHLCGLLDRQLGGLLALENPAGIKKSPGTGGRAGAENAGLRAGGLGRPAWPDNAPTGSVPARLEKEFRSKTTRGSACR
jgi:hypothetical protein